jgi:tRNA 2-selenouridine synthase
MDDLAMSLIKIRKRLGEEKFRCSMKLLDENKKDEACRIILDYYDKTYEYGLQKRLPEQVFRLNSNKLSIAEIILELTQYEN